MTTPAISVAMCTFNGERYLREQLESLVAQDIENYEVIAVDDHSSDRSWDILQTWANGRSNWRTYRNGKTLGFSENFQYAISLCTGEWIAPCDQDDIWAPEKLRDLLAQAKNSSLAYCDSALIDGNGQSLGSNLSDIKQMYSGADARAFALNNCISGHALIFRSTLVRQALPIPKDVYYDWWLGFVAASNDGVQYIPRPLVRFRRHDANTSSMAVLPVASKASLPNAHESELARLRAMADFPGPAQLFYQRLYVLWERRTSHLLQPKLLLFLLKNSKVVFSMRRSRPWAKFKHAFKYFWGVPQKKQKRFGAQ